MRLSSWPGLVARRFAFFCFLAIVANAAILGQTPQGRASAEQKRTQGSSARTRSAKSAGLGLTVSPSAGAPGSEVMISGSGFGVQPGTVTLNGTQSVVDPGSWTDMTVRAHVPLGMPAGSATLTVTSPNGTSKSVPFVVLAPPIVRYKEISGDFRPFINPDNAHLTVQVSLLTQDLEVIGQSTSAPFTLDKMRLFYTQTDPKSIPAWVLVGTQIPGDHLYPFVPTKVPGLDSSVAEFQEVIMGDFCLLDAPLPDGHCTMGLVKVDGLGNSVVPQDPPVAQIRAYAQAADGTSNPATVNSIGPNSAAISFTGPKSFKPAWVILEGISGAHKFAYAPAPPVQTSDLLYTADDLNVVCNVGPTRPGCLSTIASDLVLKSIASDATATFVALQENGKDHLFVAHIRAPMGLEPTAILVTNKTNNPPTSVIVRRTLKPGQNTNILNVDMTIMDQTTVARNFGQRIAKRYLAVTLDVKNPTVKKLQFSKGALYFDVDYIEAKEKNLWEDFYYRASDLLSLGMNNPSSYKSSAFTKADNARLFRFGLDQNVKQSPINYLSALGSFDATTEKTGQEFDTVQLLASIMNTIATGGIAGTGQFRSASALLSGVFLPGLKGIVLNDSRINRLRANLVSQTLQEVISVPPTQPTSTIVLLPRNGILAFHDAEIPVMIHSIRDVHIVPEVVTEATETPVQKDQCKVGYTKEQTREALGEPTGVTTNADGTSVFTYPTGPIASASFEAGGALVSCQQRSNSDQLAQAKTLVEMNQTLTRIGLTVSRITLTDGSIVLADIPGVQQTFHFDAKGNKTTDYVFLFSQIRTYETGTKDALETFLEKPDTALSPARASEIKDFIEKNKTVKANQVLYPSPDIQNGLVIVTFKDATNIASITFQGDKPAGVN